MARDRKAIEEQMAALQAELDADDDDELWVEHPKTKAVARLRGSQATRFLAGILGDDDQDDDDQDDDDQDDDAGRKGARRTTKKTAAKKPRGRGADDDQPDEPPARQSVWGRR